MAKPKLPKVPKPSAKPKPGQATPMPGPMSGGKKPKPGKKDFGA